MTDSQKNEMSYEDQLADFTDRLLGGEEIRQEEATLAPDFDLRALAQTAQRLYQAFGGDDPDEETIQRMHQGIIEQWRQKGTAAQEPFWRGWLDSLLPSRNKWQSRRSRQRVSIAASLATLAIILIAAFPLLNTITSNQPGASGQNPGSVFLLVTGLLILLAVWLFRRKP